MKHFIQNTKNISKAVVLSLAVILSFSGSIKAAVPQYFQQAQEALTRSQTIFKQVKAGLRRAQTAFDKAQNRMKQIKEAGKKKTAQNSLKSIKKKLDFANKHFNSAVKTIQQFVKFELDKNFHSASLYAGEVETNAKLIAQ